MSVLRRITQETFDEVVQENIEEFDMTKEEAVQDATQQFFKQGIDLSNIDITTGEGRKELLEIFQSLLQTTIPSPDTPTTISQLQQITEAVQKQNPHYRRNITLIYHQGGLNAIHAHLDAREDVTILAIVIQLISELSLSNVEIRDFFEPGGSIKINGIITKLLSSSVNATNTPAEFTLLESSINLSRIVAKSEKNKTALIHAGIGNSVVQILQFYSTPTLNPTAITLLEKTTSLLRELCIHTDTRTEMSSAFDNGKFFIKQNQLIPIFIAIIRQYEQYPQLASNTLLAMKSMTTTNEAVQIISLHGIIELLSNVLSSYTKLILQLVSGESPIMIENLKNENIDADNRVISAEEAEEAEEDGADRTDLPLSGKKKTSPLLLLRSVVALIRNIIADDKKKEQFVTYGALESLVVLFLHSQQISSVTSATSSTESSSTTNKLSANLSNEWNITNDYFLIEHMFGCFAQFTLRSPKNSLYMMSENYSIFLPLMITYMKKYPQQDSLHRQICLMLHNIINRCPQFKTIFLDYHLEEILRNVSGVLPTVKDEAYVLLRDLGINIQYMKLDEQTGKLVPVYETFGNQSNRNFKAIYDEADNFQDRMVEEAHAPFGEKDIVVEVKRSGREKKDHDDHDDHDEADHDHSHSHHHEHSENCAHGEDHHSPHDNAQNHDDHHEHNHEHHH